MECVLNTQFILSICYNATIGASGRGAVILAAKGRVAELLLERANRLLWWLVSARGCSVQLAVPKGIRDRLLQRQRSPFLPCR